MTHSLAGEFERTGRVWLRGALSESDLADLDALTQPGRPGARLDPTGASDRVLGRDGSVGQIIATIWPGMRPTRVVAFSKDAEANWGVPWHQDRVITVRGRAEASGCRNWSLKAGQWHCEPPRETLDAMLFVRLHLDPATASNGPMEIALGSHRRGIVPASEVASVVAEHDVETCLAARGDVLILAMLTQHSSGPSLDGSPRRVLRVDFAASPPPHPLEWA